MFALQICFFCRYNQVNIIRTACNTGVAECQNLTQTWFKLWMDNPQHNLYVHMFASWCSLFFFIFLLIVNNGSQIKLHRIHPNLRSVVYCSAIAKGGEEEWEFGWSQFKSSTLASEASKLMSALACTTKTLLLDRCESLNSEQQCEVVWGCGGHTNGNDYPNWNLSWRGVG